MRQGSARPRGGNGDAQSGITTVIGYQLLSCKGTRVSSRSRPVDHAARVWERRLRDVLVHRMEGQSQRVSHRFDVLVRAEPFVEVTQMRRNPEEVMCYQGEPIYSVSTVCTSPSSFTYPFLTVTLSIWSNYKRGRSYFTATSSNPVISLLTELRACYQLLALCTSFCRSQNLDRTNSKLSALWASEEENIHWRRSSGGISSTMCFSRDAAQT